MSRGFCISCGAPRQGTEAYCTSCGAPLLDPAPESGNNTVRRSASTDAPGARFGAVPPAPTGSGNAAGSGRKIALIALGAILLGGFVGGGVALMARGGSAAAPTNRGSPTPVDTRSGIATAPAPQPSASPTPQPGVGGKWAGEMMGGKYSFTLTLGQTSDGRVSGEMYQYEYSTGRSGTEVVKGRQTDRRLALDGTGWKPGTPSGWKLDHIVVRLSDRGVDTWDSMSGTYDCDGCHGPYSISGKRVS